MAESYNNYSILMSVYKNDKPEFLSLAIESMLNQTVKSNDFVIVKDGPLGDELVSILDRYAKEHKEIHIVGLDDNSGLGKALDFGLSYCKNELVARMDADDISLPQRCEKLLAAFKNNPVLSIIGTNIDEFIDDPNHPVSSRIVPSTDKDIKKYIHRRSPFNHPTVMFKKSEVIRCGGYGPLKRKQDMDLFSRMLNMGCTAENIPESLLLFRAGEDNLKRRRGKEYINSTIQVAKLNYKRKYISFFDLLYIVLGQYFLRLMPKSASNKLLRKDLKDNKQNKKADSFISALMLLISSSLIFCLTFFGVNKSSLTSLERWCHQLSAQEGENTCVAYYLKDESEAKRKSLIEPVNEYNAYRSKELGRSVSFVRDGAYTISIDSNTISSSSIVYGDYLNQRFTSSRISILRGTLSEEDFDAGKQIFVSQALYNDLTKLGYTEITEKEATLSLDNNTKFTIGGVVSVNGLNDLGVHIRHFFSDRFVLLGSKNIYNFDFTDLVFGSDDYHFADDLLDFERKIQKSYLNYKTIGMRSESVIGTDMVRSDRFTLEDLVSRQEIWLSVGTISGIVVLLLIEIFTFVTYKKGRFSLFSSLVILIGGLISGFCPLLLGVLLMKSGSFMSRFAISIIILHSAECLLFVICKSGIFDIKKPMEVEEK